MNSLPLGAAMDRAANPDDELQMLRILCGESTSREQQLEILRSLRDLVFRDPEHQVVLESVRILCLRDALSADRLAVHLNNRGFPDVILEKYFTSAPTNGAAKENAAPDKIMPGKNASQSGFSKSSAAVVLVLAALCAMLSFFARPVRRLIRESFMQRVTSAHYEILCPPGTMKPEAMRDFAAQREPLFTTLNQRLNGVASNAEIRIIFYPDASALAATDGAAAPYEVTGTTIRTIFNGPPAQLDPAADADALLHVAWGNPGNPRIGEWAGTWLVGEWRGEELGMAAAAAEQRLGHQTVSSLLDSTSRQIPSREDRNLLGAAWLTEIADLDGPAEVRKLYLSRIPALDVAQVTKALGTTSLELDRKWQMWMYSYLAGMPSAPNSMSMPMGMPMQ
jgi:hypothetical protein